MISSPERVESQVGETNKQIAIGNGLKIYDFRSVSSDLLNAAQWRHTLFNHVVADDQPTSYLCCQERTTYVDSVPRTQKFPAALAFTPLLCTR